MKRSRPISLLVLALVLLAAALSVSIVLAEAPGPVTDGVHIKPDLSTPLNAPASPTAVTFYLPWKGGQTWETTNGHCGDGHSCEDVTNFYALDFKPAGGATGDVVAVADGTVCYVQESIGDSVIFSAPHAGNVVVIAHEGNCVERQNGTYSFYAHLKQSSVPVSAGQVIRRGTVIGHYGGSGYTFGAHLHFSINSQYWTYSQFGYTTASVISKFATFADQDVQQTGGVPRAGLQYRSDNYEGFTCTDVLPVGEGSSRKQLFVDAYNRMGGRAKLGCTRGGAYWWSDSGSGLAIVRQDFTGNDGSNQVMITHNEQDDSPTGSVPAYVTWGALYSRWIALGSIGTTAYGIPTSDEYFNGNNQPQSSFTNGTITWDGDSFEFYNWPGANVSQWRIKYFNGRNYDFNREPTWVRNYNSTIIDFDWGEDSPGSGGWGVWGDNFSMVAAKQILFDAGRYQFQVQADDGVKLWVDNTLLIDEWHSSPGNHYDGEINLTQGSHLIVLAYYEDAGAALVDLNWSKINPPAVPTINPIDNADGDGNYTVSWSASAGTTAYVLQEQSIPGSFFDIYTGSATSRNLTGRAAARWCYRVRATNSAGSSGNSYPEVCTDVQNLPAVPTLAGPAADAVFNRDAAVTLSWNTAAGATRYYAEVWGGPSVANGSGWMTGTSWAVGQLWGGSYQWRVNARNAAGVESGWSETRAFTVKIGSPANLTAAAVSGTQIDLAWGPSADAAILDGYRVYRNGAYVATVGGSTTLYQDTGLNCETAYSYTVKAYRGAAESDAGNTANAVTGGCIGNVVTLSPAGNGTVGGLAFTAADVLRYERAANRWTMVYDGSARGTPKKIAAFSLLDDGDLLLVFAANQGIAGLGTATPYDVVRFTPHTPNVYPLGPGTYGWFFQGRPLGLTTSGEKIDAIDWAGSWVTFSTTGAAALPLPGGATLKAADEDVFVYELNNARWRSALLVDGSLIPGMAAEDVSGVWDDPNSGDLYVTITGAFSVGGAGGAQGNGKSIVRLAANGGASVYTPSLLPWLAAGASFPGNLGGIDLGR